MATLDDSLHPISWSAFEAEVLRLYAAPMRRRTTPTGTPTWP